MGLIPGSGRSPGVGNCNPLQYSCLENSMDRGSWYATVHRVAKSRARLSMQARMQMLAIRMPHCTIPASAIHQLCNMEATYLPFSISIYFLPMSIPNFKSSQPQPSSLFISYFLSISVWYGVFAKHTNLPPIIHPFHYQTSIGLIFLCLPFLLIPSFKTHEFPILMIL